MNTFDKINSVLRADDYAIASDLPQSSLHLRSAKSFADLATDITHLIWADLLREGDWPSLDPHRFIRLARALENVLLRRLNDCDVSVPFDPWSHSGGGRTGLVIRPTVCPDHTMRLLHAAGTELQTVLTEMEKTTDNFLVSHTPPFTYELTPEHAERVHASIEMSVKPYLIKNLATTCCEQCGRYPAEKL